MNLTLVAAVAAPILLLLLGVVLLFNGLVRGKNLAREAWSGIDVQLRRRHDLVPALVECVKGYARHEHSVLEEIAESRSRGMAAREVGDRVEAENALTRSIRGLLVLVENYPDLKASEVFLDLQKRLAEVEDEIQLARRYYNGTVRDYNIRMESFPGNIVASAGGFRPMEFFEIETATQCETPGVKL